MKKLSLITSVLLAFVLFTNCEEETVITVQELPTEINSFVENHFENSTISYAEKVRFEDEKYKITLSTGYKISFNKKNEMIKISGNSQVPNSVIPEQILDYVNSNFSSNYIEEWKKEKKNHEVKLDNDLELVFDKNEQFLKMDD